DVGRSLAADRRDPRLDWQLRQWAFVEGPPRRRQGQVQLRATGKRCLANDFLGGRVDHRLVALGRLHPFAIDVEGLDIGKSDAHGCLSCDYSCSCAKTWRVASAGLARPAVMISAARKAMAMAGALVLPEGSVGMIEVSTTRTPSTPRTRSSGSTTESASPPMRQVPATW